MDGGALERELRRRDPLLSLQGWPSATHGCILWRVVRESGPDRPPETVAVWQSESGEPYPLSSGLLDLVDRLDRNSRHRYLDEDALERTAVHPELRDQQVARSPLDVAHAACARLANVTSVLQRPTPSCQRSRKSASFASVRWKRRKVEPSSCRKVGPGWSP